MNDKNIYKELLANLNQDIRQISEQKLFKRGTVKVDFSLFYKGEFLNVFIIDSKLKLDFKFKKRSFRFSFLSNFKRINCHFTLFGR